MVFSTIRKVSKVSEAYVKLVRFKGRGKPQAESGTARKEAQSRKG